MLLHTQISTSSSLPLPPFSHLPLHLTLPHKEKQHTSFLATGFSINTKCVKLPNVPNVSKSANSLNSFAVKTKVVRYGILFAREGCMLEIRFLARRRVRRRGESGKLPRIWMSLSVRSIASCGCYS